MPSDSRRRNQDDREDRRSSGDHEREYRPKRSDDGYEYAHEYDDRSSRRSSDSKRDREKRRDYDRREYPPVEDDRDWGDSRYRREYAGPRRDDDRNYRYPPPRDSYGYQDFSYRADYDHHEPYAASRSADRYRPGRHSPRQSRYSSYAYTISRRSRSPYPRRPASPGPSHPHYFTSRSPMSRESRAAVKLLDDEAPLVAMEHSERNVSQSSHRASPTTPPRPPRMGAPANRLGAHKLSSPAPANRHSSTHRGRSPLSNRSFSQTPPHLGKRSISPGEVPSQNDSPRGLVSPDVPKNLSSTRPSRSFGAELSSVSLREPSRNRSARPTLSNSPRPPSVPPPPPPLAAPPPPPGTPPQPDEPPPPAPPPDPRVLGSNGQHEVPSNSRAFVPISLSRETGRSTLVSSVNPLGWGNYPSRPSANSRAPLDTASQLAWHRPANTKVLAMGNDSSDERAAPASGPSTSATSLPPKPGTRTHPSAVPRPGSSMVPKTGAKALSRPPPPFPAPESIPYPPIPRLYPSHPQQPNGTGSQVSRHPGTPSSSSTPPRLTVHIPRLPVKVHARIYMPRLSIHLRPRDAEVEAYGRVETRMAERANLCASETSGMPNGKENSPRADKTKASKKDADNESMYVGAFRGCGMQADYNLTTKLGEGTFGEVHKAIHRKTKRVVALKRILMHNEKEGMPVTALREIKILKALKHECIVDIVDMFVVKSSSQSSFSVYMVFPYMDHDLAGLLENDRVKLQPSHIKLYMQQLLRGTEYMHRNHILHRDMKAANLLISNDGSLKIADFGLARAVDPRVATSSVQDRLTGRDRKYTNCVVTRWYRPPELLLGSRNYGGEVDIWGIGCIMGEMFMRRPILVGSSDLDQLDKIWQLCGTPNQQTWPCWDDLPGCEGVKRFSTTYTRSIKKVYASFGDDTVDLIDRLLTCNPRARITASEALDHNYFWTDPLPADPKSLPTYEASHEFDKRAHLRPPQPQRPPGPPSQPQFVSTQPYPSIQSHAAPPSHPPRGGPTQSYGGPPQAYGRPPQPYGAPLPLPPLHWHSGANPGLPPKPNPRPGRGGGGGGGRYGHGGGNRGARYEPYPRSGVPGLPSRPAEGLPPSRPPPPPADLPYPHLPSLPSRPAGLPY